jgi:acyl-CoA synthetase (NDP forming)
VLPFAARGPRAVDLAIIGIANARIEAAMVDAAALGAGSVVTFSSLYEEPSNGRRSPSGSRRSPPAHGMAVCGGNGMGFVNVPGKLRATGFATPDDLRPGPVTFLSHSGSAFAALAFNDRGIGFDLLVSSGHEIVTTADEYLWFALERESTRVVALLLETGSEPRRLPGGARACRRTRRPGGGAHGRANGCVEGDGDRALGRARRRARRVRGGLRRVRRTRGPVAR